MHTKFAKLSDYEVYILKRALIHGGAEIYFSDIYDDKDKEIYSRLLNELQDEDLERSKNSPILSD